MRDIERAKRLLDAMRGMKPGEQLTINLAMASALVSYYDHIRSEAEKAIEDAHKARLQKLEETRRADDMQLQRDAMAQEIIELLSENVVN